MIFLILMLIFFCLAETSATSTIQKQMTFEARKKGFIPFWGPPVQSRQSFEFDRPSLRGGKLRDLFVDRFTGQNLPLRFFGRYHLVLSYVACHCQDGVY